MALEQVRKDLKQAFRHFLAGSLSLAIAALLGLLAYHLFAVSKDQAPINTSRTSLDAPDIVVAAAQKDPQPVTPDIIPDPEFTTNDKSVKSNGNFSTAINRINSAKSNITSDGAEKIPVSQLMLKPYSYLGKLITVSGEIYKIEQMPPDREASPGDWYAILLITKNINSPLGWTTIDCTYNGDPSSLVPKSKIEFSGYFIGIGESPNSVGGNVEVVGLVGNAIRTPGRPQPVPSISYPRSSAPPETSQPQISANLAQSKPAKFSKVQSRRHTKSQANTGRTAAPILPETHRPTTLQIIERLQKNQ